MDNVAFNKRYNITIYTTYLTYCTNNTPTLFKRNLVVTTRKYFYVNYKT